MGCAGEPAAGADNDCLFVEGSAFHAERPTAGLPCKNLLLRGGRTIGGAEVSAPTPPTPWLPPKWSVLKFREKKYAEV